MNCETCGKKLVIEWEDKNDQAVVGLSLPPDGDMYTEMEFLIQCWDCKIPNEFRHYEVGEWTVAHISQKRFANASWGRVRDTLLENGAEDRRSTYI